MSKSFYNTIGEKGQILLDLEEKAKSQQDTILDFFKQHPNMGFTPFDIHKAILPNVPITSVRRGITNLTKEGKLRKTQMKVIETYGTLNFKWIYNGQ